jgi:hypothetical protein
MADARSSRSHDAVRMRLMYSTTYLKGDHTTAIAQWKLVFNQ